MLAVCAMSQSVIPRCVRHSVTLTDTPCTPRGGDTASVRMTLCCVVWVTDVGGELEMRKWYKSGDSVAIIPGQVHWALTDDSFSISTVRFCTGHLTVFIDMSHHQTTTGWFTIKQHLIRIKFKLTDFYSADVASVPEITRGWTVTGHCVTSWWQGGTVPTRVTAVDTPRLVWARWYT